MRLHLIVGAVILFTLASCSNNTVIPLKMIKLTPVEKLPEYLSSRSSFRGEESELDNTNQPTSEQRQAAAEHVQKQIDILMNECRPILTGFEEKIEKGAKNALWLSIAGLISGSIIAPALTTASPESNAVWISALSSFGGASNIMSRQLENSGMSGTHAAQARNQIITRIRDQLEIVFSNTDNPEKQLIALARAKSECGLYTLTVPSIVDTSSSDASPQAAASAPTSTATNTITDDLTPVETPASPSSAGETPASVFTTSFPPSAGTGIMNNYLMSN